MPTICLLAGAGHIGPTALQIAFACDLRAIEPQVTMDFGAASGTLPGTLAFRLAKHVGAGAAMAMMAQEQPVTADEAVQTGAVQWLAPSSTNGQYDGAWLAAKLERAPHGASLLLCRYLLHDSVWTVIAPDCS